VDLYLHSPVCVNGRHRDFNFIGSEVTYYDVLVFSQSVVFVSAAPSINCKIARYSCFLYHEHWL
jgi:hypothetical protein